MHTILVADDSVTIQRAVEIAFDKEPFQVVKVGSGADAIARAKQLKPAIVLADHLMADKSGYEVAEALRADPTTSSIPVLMFSGTSAPYDEGRARAAGVVGHLPKPFDCQTLLDRVRNLLGVAATAPGSMVAASPPASAAAMPRPPGAPGLPRPPAGPGVPSSPPVSGSGVTTGVTPRGAPASVPPSAPVAASSPPRATAPQHDPFGFGAVQSTPPTGAAPVAAARPAGNPFATATPIASPDAAAPGVGISATSDMWTSQPQHLAGSSRASSLPSAPSVKTAEGVQADRTAVQARTASPSQAPAYAEAEFLEVADIEPADVPMATPRAATPAPAVPPAASAAPKPAAAPGMNGNGWSSGAAVPSAAALAAAPAATAHSTSKVDLQRLAALDAQAAPTATPAGDLIDRVVERVAASVGAGPSRAAMSDEARAIVERIAWEVVPELAEVIIREEIQRLLKAR